MLPSINIPKNENGQTENDRFVHFCDPDWIRTNDPQLRRLMLYPAELPDHAGCHPFARAAAKIIFSTIASKRIVHGCSD